MMGGGGGGGGALEGEEAPLCPGRESREQNAVTHVGVRPARPDSGAPKGQACKWGMKMGETGLWLLEVHSAMPRWALRLSVAKVVASFQEKPEVWIYL